MLKLNRTINFNKKLKSPDNPELKHDLKRGKARECAKCSIKYGCCKLCNLCKKCHSEKFGGTTIIQDYQNKEKEYYQKQDAKRNPGNEKYYNDTYYDIDDDY